jgi:hypothetical protein
MAETAIVPTTPTPAMIAAAWTAFRGDRRGRLIGPGPAFVEAIRAAIEAGAINQIRDEDSNYQGHPCDD